MKRIAALILASVLLISSNPLLAGTPNYNPSKFEYEDLTSGKVVSYTMIFFQNDTDEINITRLEVSGMTMYGLQLRYSGSNWRFLEGLTVKADEEVIQLNLISPPTRDVLDNGKGVSEVLNFMLTDGQASKITSAAEVKVQYYGVPNTVDEKGVANLNKFYEEFIK
mgnify:CR=1 FL=1|jgi:hypothetical protein